jgi:type II secretory pathway predicted ATPase ExeA
MQYALFQGEGMVLITGQPGTGKSALIHRVIAEHGDQYQRLDTIECARFSGSDLLIRYADLCGIELDTENVAGQLTAITAHLRTLHQQSKRSVLILDETHLLTDEALEMVRLLSNLREDNEPLLQIFLVGQPLLRERLLSPELSQLHQRVIATCKLEALNEAETQGYVLQQLTARNWDASAGIADGVYRAIHSASLGIPRWVNLICNRIMIHVLANERPRIEFEDICEILQDLIREDLLPEEVRQANIGATPLRLAS